MEGIWAWIQGNPLASFELSFDLVLTLLYLQLTCHYRTLVSFFVPVLFRCFPSSYSFMSIFIAISIQSASETRHTWKHIPSHDPISQNLDLVYIISQNCKISAC